jgi:hypothetical protein
MREQASAAIRASYPAPLCVARYREMIDEVVVDDLPVAGKLALPGHE